jgi:hypothetical protein
MEKILFLPPTPLNLNIAATEASETVAKQK